LVNPGPRHFSRRLCLWRCLSLRLRLWRWLSLRLRLWFLNVLRIRNRDRHGDEYNHDSQSLAHKNNLLGSALKPLNYAREQIAPFAASVLTLVECRFYAHHRASKPRAASTSYAGTES